VRLSPETCRVKPLRRIKTQLLHLVGLISLLYQNTASVKLCPMNMTLFSSCFKDVLYYIRVKNIQTVLGKELTFK